MRVDFHTHIFPPETVADRSRFFDGEPAFRWLYDSPKARLATAETLLEAMDRDGVDKSVVFGFPWENGERAARHNDYVLECASRYGDRLIPLACVQPLAPHAAEEAERCLATGARGLGELAVYGDCNSREVLTAFDALIKSVRSHGAILLVHANEPVGHAYPGKCPLELTFYYNLARMAEGLPLILAHWGGGLCFYELLRREAADVLKNVYYDTAASPFLYRPEIYAIMARVPELGRKILFGSDYPLLSPARCFRDLDTDGSLTEAEREALCGGNALRLLDTVQPT